MKFKRVFDFVVAGGIFLLACPGFLTVALVIFLYDFHNPLYIADRVGKNGKSFRMAKFRSMIVDAAKTGVTSTSEMDSRILPVGRFIRRYKFDEFMQLWNVVCGDMSLVGPRPNVRSGVVLYTPLERRLLEVRPGVTDLASIVFSDEGEILKGYPDADVAYDQLIRPWKSRLGLFYIETQNAWLDLQLVWLTIVSMVSRQMSLRGVHQLLLRYGAPDELAQIALRREALVPRSPPGSETAAV